MYRTLDSKFAGYTGSWPECGDIFAFCPIITAQSVEIRLKKCRDIFSPCTVFYELYANLHRILRALHKFAPYFTSFKQICTVFYELYANLHRILRALRTFAPYFTSFTQICIVFFQQVRCKSRGVPQNTVRSGALLL